MRPKAFITRSLLSALIVTPAVFFVSAVSMQLNPAGISLQFQAAHAQDDEEQPERRTRRAQAVSESVNKRLAAVSAFLQPEDEKAEPDLQGALKELNDINYSKWSEYEKAQVYNLYGAVYVQMERYADAIKYYKMYVETPDIPEAQALNVSWYLAQLYLATERYKEAIALLEDYIKRSEIVGGDHYFKLGQAYYQDGNEAKALVNVDKAVQMFEDAGRLPTESMFQYQYSLYANKEDYNKVISIVQKMIRHYPKVQYWKVLASMLGQVGRTADQLAAYETIYEMGGLDKEKELLVLASLYLEAEYPYKAAKILDKAVKDGVVESTSKNLQTLGVAWSLAKETEKAIPVMEQAAKKSDDGELYMRLQHTYASTDDFEKSINAGREALKRSVKKPSEVQLTLGIAYFNLNKFDDALKAFNEARKDKNMSDQARQWIRYTESEKARIAKLESSV